MTATRPRGGSVFLVEDEVMIRMMVADMLEELGFRVAAEAGEIGEALRLAQVDVPAAGTDLEALAARYVSVTPLRLDRTDEAFSAALTATLK